MDFKKMFKTEDCTSKFKESDIEQNKVLSLFSYLGILFLIPLLACKDSNYAKFHINQGLKLWIVSIAIGVVSGLISFVLNILLICFTSFNHDSSWINHDGCWSWNLCY